MQSALTARGESPASIETGDAPGSQGATSEHIGQYVSEEQRREAGCSAGRMPADFHHGLLRALAVIIIIVAVDHSAARTAGVAGPIQQTSARAPRQPGLFKDSRQTIATARAQGRSHIVLLVAA